MMALPLAGCGTFGNVCWLNREEGGQRVYGGVRAEVEILQASEGTSGSTWVNSDDHRRKEVLWCLLDLPFSVIGDTLTLPVTVYAAMANGSSDQSAPRADPKAASVNQSPSIPK
jgi:uncharacterized protein YceK